MTNLPTWAVYVVSLGTPALAFIGAIVGSWWARRSAKEQGDRSRHEEVMRNLRWAAELAVSTDERLAELGVAELNALTESNLLDEDEKLFIDAALESVVQEPVEELEESGEGTEVLIDSPDADETAEDLSSDDQAKGRAEHDG